MTYLYAAGVVLLVLVVGSASQKSRADMAWAISGVLVVAFWSWLTVPTSADGLTEYSADTELIWLVGRVVITYVVVFALRHIALAVIRRNRPRGRRHTGRIAVRKSDISYRFTGGQR